jgi:hypothetical protein
MHSRVLLSLAFIFVSSLLLLARDDDPTKEKIFKAKTAYTAEIAKLRSEVIASFDKKEEKARSKGDKKVVDEIKDQRAAFDEAEEWPTDMTADLRMRLTKARTQLETTYQSALKEYIKAKKDEEAAAMEKEIAEFRRAFWPLLDLAKIEVKDGLFRIPPDTMVTTKKLYKGGVEIAVVAKTEGESIRLHAHRGATVIFNWEVNPTELRVHRADGNEKGEGSSLANPKVTPLRPNTYYTLKWRLAREGMAIYVNGQVVFTEKKEYDLDVETKIAVVTLKSAVVVKEFKVTPILAK